MKRIFNLSCIMFIIFCASCTKEVNYTKEALMAMAEASDSSFTVILPRSINEGVSCSEYTEGCISAHIGSVRKLEFIAVEFDTQRNAMRAAKKFRGYYSRNWFFDDVAGEPYLEKFVTEHLEAKKP